MTQKNVSHNPAKFLIFSIIGILYFFVPLAPTASGRTTWLVQSVNLIKGWLKPCLSYIVLIFVALLVIGCIIAKVTDKFPLLTKMYGSVKVYSIVLYVLGLIFAVMVVFQVGPAAILDPAVGADGLGISKTVIVTIIIAGLFVIFVTDFGLLELIGALIEPLMRPVFKVPGYASIDAVTSFVANPTLGIFLTNRLYKDKMYTTREAASISTNFSFISMGFFAVLVESAGILDHYGDVVLWSFLLSFAIAAIMIRIPPLRGLPDLMYDGSPRPEEKKAKYSAELFKNAMIKAVETGNSVDVAATFKKTLMDVFIFAQKISAYIMCIYVLVMVVVKNTNIADYLGIPFVPILNLLGIPNAAEIAPSFILGLAEVALPSAFISGLGVAPAAAFFVVTVTALQIIMFSNSAVSIMESDIPLNVGKLVIIFFLRTLIAMPLVAIVTHFIF
jgi:nucleoside recognition membrane protein YjiH